MSVPPTCDVLDQSACVDNIAAPLESRMIKHFAGAVALRKINLEIKMTSQCEFVITISVTRSPVTVYPLKIKL